RGVLDGGEGTEQGAAARVTQVRAALTFCFSPGGDLALATALAAVAAPTFIELSLLTECARWSETALAALAQADRGGRREMQLQAAFGASSMFTRGNSPEGQAALARALALADQLGDLEQEMRLLTSLDIFHHRLGEFREALATGERIQSVAERLHDPDVRKLCDWILGTTYHLLGNQIEAERR